MHNLSRSTRTVFALVLLLAALSATGAYSREEVNRTVLPNGLILLVKEEAAENIVGFEILFKVGLMEEESGISGSTNLVQNILLARITGDGTDDVEATGSAVRTETTPDFSRIQITCTGEYFLPMLARTASAVSQREMRREEVEKEKKRVLDELEAEEGAFKAIYNYFLKSFYQYHPYRKPDIGYARTVESLTPENLREFFDRWYVPNRMVVSVVGNVRKKDVITKVEELFGALKPRKEETVDISWEPKAEEQSISLSSGSNLAWILIGFPAPCPGSENYAAMKVVYSLLCDGLSSRFWTEVREKRGLAYELGAMYPTLKGPGHFLSYLITAPNQVSKARKAIIGELKRMRSERIGEDELAGTKRKVLGKYLLERETCNGTAHALGAAEALGVGYQYDEAFPELLDKVTASDCLRVAREYLEDYTMIIARPAGQFYIE